MFRQPLLAESLRKVAHGGADEFYKGELARQIVAGIQARGGVITLADMAAYRADVSQAIMGSYRGAPIAFMPPTASGVSVAEALNLLEHFDLKSMGWGSVDALHLISEGSRRR